MSLPSSGRSLLVGLIALCFIHFTDTHDPPGRPRNVPVINSGPIVRVRDLLTGDQLRSIRTRWTARGFDSSRLESMLRSNSRDFIAQHGQRTNVPVLPGRRSSPVLPQRGGFLTGSSIPQDPIGLRGRIRGNRRNRQQNGHEGHNHGSIGESINIIGQNGRSSRRNNRQNRRSRQSNGIGRGQRIGADEMIPLEELGRSGGEPDVGFDERIPEAELQRLLRGRPDGIGGGGITTGGIRDRDRQRGRTRIDPLGRSRVDGHEHGHGQEHGHVGHHGPSIPGNIHGDLINRQRGGLERLDGTRFREGLIRRRNRNNAVHVVPPQQTRRRRRRNGIANAIRNVVGTLLG